MTRTIACVPRPRSRRSIRVLAITALVATIAALGLLGSPALAVLPSFDPALEAFNDRLAQGSSTSSDLALSQRVKALFNHYLRNDFPQDPPDQVAESFLLNLIERFRSMTNAEVDAFREDFANLATDPSAFDERCNLLFNAVAFATVADDKTWQRAPGDQTSEWGRLPGKRTRQLDPKKGWSEWKAATERFKAFDAARRRAHQNPTLAFYGPDDTTPPESLAAIPRRVWVEVFERRLEVLYGRLGISVPPGLLRDLAQVQYVMSGWQMGANGPERVATAALRRLNDALRLGRLEAILHEGEVEHGFRREHPMPTQILSLRVFSLLLRAGYMLRDVGVPLAHGEWTHDIQWAALISDYLENPDEYTYLPIEIFVGIGAYDAELPALAKERFAFERPMYSLWALLFDFPYANKTLANFLHANGVRELIASEPSLQRLSQAIEELHNARLQVGRDLFAAWLAYRDNPQVLPEALSFLTPELNRQLERAYALYSKTDPVQQALATDNVGDRLYLADRYARAISDENYRESTMANETGGQDAVPVMMPYGQALMDNSTDAPFRLEVQRQVQRRDAALLAAQPAPSAPPITDADLDLDSLGDFEEEFDPAALADDDLEAEAELERSERQRAGDDDDNDSLSAREADAEREASQDNASSSPSAPGISEEESRDAANERLLAGSPEAPAIPPELALAPPPPSAPPGDRALRVGETAATPAGNRNDQVEPEKEEESKKAEPIAEPAQ